jgi:hypothetical protein
VAGRQKVMAAALERESGRRMCQRGRGGRWNLGFKPLVCAMSCGYEMCGGRA